MQRRLHYNAKNVSTDVSHLSPKVATRISTSLYLILLHSGFRIRSDTRMGPIRQEFLTSRCY